MLSVCIVSEWQQIRISQPSTAVQQLKYQFRCLPPSSSPVWFGFWRHELWCFWNTVVSAETHLRGDLIICIAWCTFFLPRREQCRRNSAVNMCHPPWCSMKTHQDLVLAENYHGDWHTCPVMSSLLTCEWFGAKLYFQCFVSLWLARSPDSVCAARERGWTRTDADDLKCRIGSNSESPQQIARMEGCLATLRRTQRFVEFFWSAWRKLCRSTNSCTSHGIVFQPFQVSH